MDAQEALDTGQLRRAENLFSRRKRGAYTRYSECAQFMSDSDKQFLPEKSILSQVCEACGTSYAAPRCPWCGAN